ncbi:hypothetical protein ACWD3I_20680 [Streptomyces sp. NPDC002817]|uniref:hypothetical protein n=1 Tax=Streptomyces sp. NPDC088357 TaxID=3154655 RepID=UPI00343414F6
MPADEVTHGADVEGSRARTGPRHAAPKKPLFTRFHMPAGKAIALAAMPTAVLMGMGFTPTLANAEDQPASKSLTADEYKDCVTALEDGASASASPSPSASASESDSDDDAEATPSASASPGSDSGGDSSSDSGSDEEAEPTPSASASSSSAGSNDAQSGATATPSPSASESSGNVLEEIGDAIEGIFTGGESASPSASASPTPSASPSESSSDDSKDDDASDAVKDTTGKVADTVEDTVKDTTDAASKAAEDTTDAVEKAAEAVTASPSPSSSTDVDDCPVATDAEGGVDNTVPLPADPWYLNASSLLLKGADYKGIVKVRTADGTVKEVLKYVISDGTDIGDLHQTVKDEQSGKTYHVQAAKGSTSTIRDGDTVMYTESISGNLLGLIPVTFSPESPPPLNIPLIYFTKVTVVQAGQFGGTLHVPGLHSYQTD